ncbi:hypothetical protein MMC07_008585 [Pseudocyphellaria aurata]|nr:hypothetical protein [Pseudocyphellaria aurata]
MAIRRKNNSPSGDRASEKTHGQKSKNHLKEQDSPAISVGTYSNERLPRRNDSRVSSLDDGCSDNRTFFNPSKVEQWVADSASGPDAFLQFASYDQVGAINGNDPSLSGAETPGSFSVSRSTVSQLSLQHSTQTAGPNGSMMNFDDMCTTNAASRIDPSLELSQGLEFDGSVDFSGEQYQHSFWSYQAPADEDASQPGAWSPLLVDPISNLEPWPQCEVSGQVYMASTFSNQRSSEGETTTAREHPLYHVGPRDDGLYHCPFAGDEDCTNKPEKLKCNYE